MNFSKMNFLSSVLLIDKLYIAFNRQKNIKEIIKGMTQEVLFKTKAHLPMG